MTINLSDYEAGKKHPGDYSDDLAAVQQRLARIQVAHIVHRRRAIVLFEGWDAAGKGGIIQRLTADWDPRNFEVWPIKAPTPEEAARHFLWRFWRRLPENGNIGVFDRSWYGRVLVERVERFATESQWRRGYDEINEFEAQQVDAGTQIIKIFVHTTQEEQDARLLARLEHPWKRWKTGADDYRNREKRDAYLDAMAEMFLRTDKGWAPWYAIDGNDKKAARIAALTVIADQLEANIDMTPPELDPALVKLARKALQKD
ncbi:polyphosphate kinase 2 family protein [Sphingomonas qilianensis]|uniref:Polyphosphate kinase n=1 Tax=Sphingomonas qilianensis TaxID=1736690 RepID=A0ABU9XMV2_9SPHN